MMTSYLLFSPPRCRCPASRTRTIDVLNFLSLRMAIGDAHTIISGYVNKRRVRVLSLSSADAIARKTIDGYSSLVCDEGAKPVTMDKRCTPWLAICSDFLGCRMEVE